MNKNKQELLDRGVFTEAELQEYEDLLVLEKYYLLINQQIDIEIDKEPKHYVFDKSRNVYRVRKLVEGKYVYYGRYVDEQDAKDKVIELKKEGVL